MITSSYSESKEYKKVVEEHLDPQITPPTTGTEITPIIPKTESTVPEIAPVPDILNPNDPQENLSTIDGAVYVPEHTASGINKNPVQGWTEPQYASDPNAGGFVRTAILSGSYGELKKLRVDSEINSETITTSWSASIGENLRVGNNVGIAGYVNLGDTASLKTGSSQPGQDPQHVFAPNKENVPDLRLVVSNSALIQDKLYVGESASVSGGLDVKEDVRIGRDLFVTGNARITGNAQIVGDEAVTGSLHVSKSIYGSENFYLTGNAEVSGTLKVVQNTYLSGNVQVQGNEAITGSLHVSKSIYGSENFFLTGNAEVTGNVRIVENLYVTKSEYVSGNLYVSGDTVITNSLTVHGPFNASGSTFWDDVYISGNLTVNGTFTHLNVEELMVKDLSITVASGATTPAQANGAGIDIDGAGMVFRYTSSTDNMGLNKRLDITGDENITGSLYVTNDTRVSGNVQVVGNEAITGSLHVDQSIYGGQNFYLTGNAIIGGNTAVTGNMDVQKDVHISGSTQISKSLAVTGSTIVQGDVSCSNSGSFKNINVEENAHIGRSASVDQYVFISGSGNGAGNSVFIQTGALNASSSIGYFHDLNLSGSDNDPCTVIVSGPSSSISASMYYGDGRGLINVTASIASSSTWKEYVDITAGATQRLHHLFQTTDVFVQVFEWDDPSYHPNTASKSSFSSPATRVNDAIVKIIDDETVDISYPQALNGYAVISDAGMMITASVDVQQCATDIAEYENVQAKKVYRFEHKLGTRNVIVAAYQYVDTKYDFGTTAPVQIFPEQISIPDQSHIDVVFGREGISGYLVIAKAGHVVKKIDDPIEWMRDYNVHYGVTGSWEANSYTTVTSSTQILNVNQYIDATKIGNKDIGPQYYQGADWGSYILFKDTGVETYVRPAANQDPIEMSWVKSNGDLEIRGRLISNGTFSTSDIKKKTNVQTIENALNSVKKMRGVKFDWKDGSGPSIGVIAQEIAAIYPELTKVAKNLDGEELMTVNYEGLIGVLIEAVKSLSTKVEELENRSR